MNTTDLSTLSNHAINMIAIQQVQDFLSSTYVFRYNENTHRIVYKRISNDEEFHYLSDYEFNSEEFYKLKYCSTVVYMVPRA